MTDMQTPSRGYRIIPGDIPNQGILFVDRKSRRRSGHGGNAIVQCDNGDILAFYSITSYEDFLGHSVSGWTEYKRSTDGGQTWSEPAVVDYSRQVHEGTDHHSALVMSVVEAPDGTLVAVLCRFANMKWKRGAPPVYLLSHDHGRTWSEPRDIHPDATLEDLSTTFNASFVHDDHIYIAFMGEKFGEAPKEEQPRRYSLYKSADNGASFQKVSNLPFDELPNTWYITAGVLPDGRFIVYAYQDRDERNLPYVTSDDQGKTWSKIERAHFAKQLRNPQLSERIGDDYFIHGRSGDKGPEKSNLVLYTSTDGIHWDEGVYLNREGRDGVNYSTNAVINGPPFGEGKRLLIQSDLAHELKRTNEHHWWIVDRDGPKQ